MSKIDEARATLREAGYFVDNLWHIDDVEGELTNEKKQSILNKALTNDTTMNQIWFSINQATDDE
jgi:hypothetical protein